MVAIKVAHTNACFFSFFPLLQIVLYNTKSQKRTEEETPGTVFAISQISQRLQKLFL